jgi:hypothetical protein
MERSAQEVGPKLAELFDAGDYDTIYGASYSPDIVSIEAGEDQKEFVGTAAIEGKNEWWESAFETHASSMEGPFPNGDPFAALIVMDIAEKASGQRSKRRQVALYSVADDLPVREQLFYAT